MLQAIREEFDSSGHGTWGISFTAPSSYWYLRWFDLPHLVQYSNFINLMSYDLHGTWDQNNEIGNKMYAHTNLTEVELALQLFWRVGIDPALINLGIGFYGRSYTSLAVRSRLAICCQVAAPLGHVPRPRAFFRTKKSTTLSRTTRTRLWSAMMRRPP
jgi:GH18 family chitinase